jgi:hypothetical protein
MATNIITQEDWEIFKNEFFSRFKNEFLDEMKLVFTNLSIYNGENEATKKVRLLKSHQVMRILGISTGKLQALRNSGKLPYSNVQGMLFYSYDDVMSLISKYRIDHSTFK